MFLPYIPKKIILWNKYIWSLRKVLGFVELVHETYCTCIVRKQPEKSVFFCFVFFSRAGDWGGRGFIFPFFVSCGW